MVHPHEPEFLTVARRQRKSGISRWNDSDKPGECHGPGAKSESDPVEGASSEGLASWGIAIDYMDGNSAAYPVGSKPQAEQEAERLRVVVERAELVG